MLRHLIFMLPLILSTSAIRVQVDYNASDPTEIAPTEKDPTEKSNNIPVYYASNEDSVDSYLVPPNPHKPVEVLPDVVVTPATYLLPPSEDSPESYYDIGSSSQSDWYPIAEIKPLDQQSDEIPISVIGNISDVFDIVQKKRKEVDSIGIPIPSRELLPPGENAPNEYLIPIPFGELQLPVQEIGKPFNTEAPGNYRPPSVHTNQYNPTVSNDTPLKLLLKPAAPTLALHLTPPRPETAKPKNPTKLYPKKYAGEFKPIPIPIAQFAEDSSQVVPKARPLKLLKPIQTEEIEYLAPDAEKKLYLYEQADQKRKLKGEDKDLQQEEVTTPQQVFVEPAPSEQEASESHYGHPGRNVHPRPAEQAAPPAPGERTEFRMHGMKGPHSYQFGYDTGKGKNRQFRYEERDNDGHIRGHYGYMDKGGKMRVVNYDAHPQLGFHAEPPREE